MRIAEARRGIEADVLERLDDPRLAFAFTEQWLVHTETLGDNVAHRHARTERAERVLKHDLHVAADRTHLLELQPLNVLAEKHDRPVRRDQAQQRQTERGFSGAGFADHAEGLALAHRDADAVHPP